MVSCALHKVFFLSTIVIWMCVAIYMLRSGTGNAESIVFTQDTVNSLKMMEELIKQNLQLKDIAEKLRLMEMHKTEVAPLQNELEHKDRFLDSIRIELKDCKIRNKWLDFQMKDLKVEKETIAQPSSDVGRGTIDFGMKSTYNHVVELWYFIHARLMALKRADLPANVVNEIDFMIEDVRARKSAALIEIELTQKSKLKTENEMKSLQKLVQKRLYYLQNPKDCRNARKLVCNLNKGCGFGCQLHHVTYCLMIAFGTERTLILESKGWRYSQDGWESVFLPLSKTCTTAANGNRVMWSGEEETKKDLVVTLPIVDALQRRPPYMPLSIPEDLAPKLEKLHGNPAVWWLGQLIFYLTRPQRWLSESISEFQIKIGFDHPVVGIHIRRTDKVGSEAAFHGIAEYMVHVSDWFGKEDMKRQRLGQPKLQKRKVYVASDDPVVLQQTRKLYPDYEILGDEEISRVAGVATRYSKASLVGVLTDIFLLSMCDYIVGTFSSQVSRVAYELMQTRQADAATLAHSLDDVFYFGGQGPHSQRAIYDHVPRPLTNDIALQVGDTLGLAGNHWDGYSKGVNRRTGRVGLYPSFKVAEILTTVKYPTFPEANYLTFNETNYK